MKKYFAANWKLHKSPKETVEFFDKFKKHLSQIDFQKSSVVFFPPAVSWQATAQSLDGTEIEFGAQNIFSKNSGAFTGENSLSMLKELGGQWGLIGHSERRTIFGENEELLLQKIEHCISESVAIIYCVGENLTERQSGKTKDVLLRQLQTLLSASTGDANLVVAYEPVWAIGTGVVAQVDQVAEAHKTIYEQLKEAGLGKTPILYGGSVKPENSKELISVEHVSGFLVGGASLDPESFLRICKS